MNNKSYNKYNFHNHTFCVFQEVPFENIENRKLDYKSRSGSCYYFTETGVYRYSNHWGRAAKCKWRLEGSGPENASRNKVGFALWTSFHSDNDSEKLYFITVDFGSKTTTYHHKNSAEYSETAVLRTADACTKVIKNIRNLFVNEAWAKHFDSDNVNSLREKIIKKLLNTNMSLQEIKSEMRNNYN